jgi:hypothetical protein
MPVKKITNSIPLRYLDVRHRTSGYSFLLVRKFTVECFHRARIVLFRAMFEQTQAPQTHFATIDFALTGLPAKCLINSEQFCGNAPDATDDRRARRRSAKVAMGQELVRAGHAIRIATFGALDRWWNVWPLSAPLAGAGGP